MKNGILKASFLVFFLSFAFTASAQSSGDSSNYLLYGLIAIAALILIAVILQVSDNLLRIEAKQLGADKSGESFSLFPSFSKMFTPAAPDYVGEEPVHRFTKGHDILLEGAAEGAIEDAEVNTFAIQPKNFIGMSPIPKVTVEVGDNVKAGDILFFDKKRPEVKYAAPVSGEVIAVNRAEKRSIAEVVILKDKDMQYRSIESFDLANGSREELVNYLLEGGAWPLIRQRPYNVVADPSETPVNIFVSTFDSAPLAPNLNLVVEGQEAAFQKGLDVLNQLTGGAVYLGLDARTGNEPAAAFRNASGVEKQWFNGPHPSGNVGIQIHHTMPVDAQMKAWTVDVQGVITIGKLLLEGKYDASRVVVIAGAEFVEPKYVRTYQGANIGDLVKDNTKADSKVRLVSGDLLSGKQKSAEQYLDFFDDQLSSIEEGDYYEMFGWLVPIAPRPSISNTFPNFLYPDYKFTPDTNTHGEKRAFVVTGQYESVLPMDIYPQQLMKSILVNDFERMEGLGIYELVEEDVALCEFVCTSKQPLQAILREGLDAMQDQG